jgi:anti-sigma factor RsiW
MSCQHLQNVITDSLAAGAELPREVRAHAEGCPACRAALERERALFSALDAGLHARANAEVPAGFIPGVRARIAGTQSPRRLFFPAWAAVLSMAAVALALTIGFVLRPHGSGLGNVSEITPPVARTVLPTGAVPDTTPPLEKIAPTASSGHYSGRIPRKAAAQAHAPAVEVLVPQEDRMALARLVSKLTKPGSPQGNTLMASLVRETDSPPIADLVIPPLEVKPLLPEPLESGPIGSGNGER